MIVRYEEGRGEEEKRRGGEEGKERRGRGEEGEKRGEEGERRGEEGERRAGGSGGPLDLMEREGGEGGGREEGAGRGGGGRDYFTRLTLIQCKENPSGMRRDRGRREEGERRGRKRRKNRELMLLLGKEVIRQLIHVLNGKHL